MTQIQGRVFDASVYGWVADVAISLSTETYATTTYVDAELALRDASIAYNTDSNNIQDASIATNATDIATNVTDIEANSDSIVSSDASIVINRTNINTNTSLLDDVSVRISGSETNITTNTNDIASNDASIVINRANITANDVSIAYLNANKADSSAIPTDFYSQAYVDGSLNDKADTSALPTDFYSQLYVDGSLGARDTSIAWLVDNMGVGDVTFAYVDGSLGARDVSIAYLDTNKADTSAIPTDFYSQAYVDGSLGERDVSIAWLSANGGGDVTTEYVDGSLNSRDVSIAWLVADNINQDTSIAGAYLAGGGGASSLQELSDVSIGSEIDNQVLAYDLDGSTYMNKSLVDVSTFSVVDASDYFWILKDTSIDYSTIVEDQTLVWDIDSSLWTNKTLVDVSLYAVDDASLYFASILDVSTKLGDSPGSIGDWSMDSSYLYICIADSSWGRLSLEKF